MRFLPINTTGTAMFSGRIALEQRSHDWMAFVTAEPEQWDCGDTPSEAITRLLISHPELKEEDEPARSIRQ